MMILFLSYWFGLFSSIVALSKVHPTVQLIKSAGFPVEEHRTVTKDGYLIVLQRMPQPKTLHPPQRVVIYFPGLFTSSLDLVIRGRKNGFGYQLYGAGFDVWMPNLRGSTTDPLTVNVTKRNPWNFSWDENALYDFPAIMDYVLATTKAHKVSTIGLSMAANIILGGVARQPQYNQNIAGIVLFAPTTRLKYTTNFSKMAAPHWRRVQKLLESTRIYKIPFANINAFRRFMTTVCSLRFIGVFICASIFFTADSTIFPIEKDLVPQLLKYYPHPGPTKSIIHYLQIMDSGRFCAFDYGREENLKRYNQSFPPEYDLAKVTAPTAIFYSKSDTLVNYKDAEWLAAQLNTGLSYSVTKRNFAHLSFMWDPDLKNIIHNKAISFLLSEYDCY